MVQAVPEGYPTVCPYLILKNARGFAEFLGTVFGGQLQEYMTKPDGAILHAEVRVGNSMIMLSEASEQMGPNPTMLHFYVKDVDDAYARALAAGGVEMRAPRDEFYGDRAGGVKEPSGNVIWIATHIEDVPPDEIARRAAAQSK